MTKQEFIDKAQKLIVQHESCFDSECTLGTELTELIQQYEELA